MKRGSPDSKKLDIDVHRESLFERRALFPTDVVGTCVHLVGEGDLLVVAGGEEADLERKGCVRCEYQ
jgi:hypothetical protein